LGRAEKTVSAQETPIGHSPGHADLNWNGLSLSAEQFHKAIAVQADDWKTELDLHQELFDKLAHRLPTELIETRAKLQQRFGI
jgi:phosphoenolpyruvate carboxykinase (GTP)